MGLFWLFIYDATMLASNGQWLASAAITLLFICAVLSFFGIRMLSRGMHFGRVGYRADSRSSRISVAAGPPLPLRVEGPEAGAAKA
jgi:hypothetical protein